MLIVTKIEFIFFRSL